MPDTTFDVSPDMKPVKTFERVDYIGKLRDAFRRPIEATWLPREPLIACDGNHSLITAIKIAFFDHYPLRLSPDVIWITLARGFALHVNEHAEELRHRFVSHSGQETLEVRRDDFVLGQENPWPEVFEAFSQQIADRTGGMSELVRADFSTTGPVERAVSDLMAMESFKTYFMYRGYIGCGIPSVTLTGTEEDWRRLRQRASRFAEFGLEEWIEALDPVLAQFEHAKAGNVDIEFWQSLFRYHSGSGPSVMTGWVNVLFPYLLDHDEVLYPNPFLKNWKERLEIDEGQSFGLRWDNPQGVGIEAVPACYTSVPLKVIQDEEEIKMRLVGGLLGVSQDASTTAVEPECGWAVIYEQPLDPEPKSKYHSLWGEDYEE